MDFLRVIFFYFSKMINRSKNVYIFGAWFGKRFSDNPKYLMLEMLEMKKYSNLKFIWIGNKEIKKDIPSNSRVKFVRRNSLKSIWYQLIASKAFVSHGFGDLGSFNFLNGAKVFQLWHGFPIKHIGADDPNNLNEGKHVYESYQFFLADSSVMADRVRTAFKNYGAKKENTVISSSPRVNYLNKNKDNELLIKSLKNRLGLSESVTVITYLPTFRDNTKKLFSFFENGDKKLSDFLNQSNSIILERQHFARNSEVNTSRLSRYVKLEEGIDVQDLLLITDYLITDYSSVYIDFLALGKPIVHFLYDGDSYKRDRGLYAKDPSEEFAGPVVYNLTDLVNVLQNKNYDFESAQKKAIKTLKISNQGSLFEKIDDIK